MKYIIIFILILGFIGCGIPPEDSESFPCENKIEGRCYFLAGHYLSIGSLADAWDIFCEEAEDYPKSGNVEDVLSEYGDYSNSRNIYEPDEYDYSVCEYSRCVINDNKKRHSMIYIYEENMIYDQSKCIYGCEFEYSDEYKDNVHLFYIPNVEQKWRLK